MTLPLCIHPVILRHAFAERALESAWRETMTCKEVNEQAAAQALRVAQREEASARVALDAHIVMRERGEFQAQWGGK